jgi:NMD protein affecting ribosome stability and mRNA decay
MKRTKKKTLLETSSIVCDACGREAEYDSMEASEYLCHSIIGGYTSVFADGARIELDLCQHCVKSLLGSVIRVSLPDVKSEQI